MRTRVPVVLALCCGCRLNFEATDDAELGTNEVRVSPDSKFLENGTKVGTGEIPLPSNVLP